MEVMGGLITALTMVSLFELHVTSFSHLLAFLMFEHCEFCSSPRRAVVFLHHNLLGQWNNGEPYGTGCMTWTTSNGGKDKYDGQFVRGNPHGIGRVFFLFCS